MKNEMIRALLAMTVFGTILLGLACGNANQNTTNSANNKVSTVPTGTQSLNCTKDDVNTSIQKAIDSKPDLKSQYQAKAFNVEADEYPAGKIRVSLSGRVIGPGNYQVIMASFAQFVAQGCVQTVKFDTAASASAISPFQWSSSCESPCSPVNGACICKDERSVMDAPNSNSKSNSNSNSNGLL